MNEQQAVDLVTKVCAGYQGTLVEHQAIQQALTIILNKAFPAPVKKEPETIKPNFDKKKK